MDKMNRTSRNSLSLARQSAKPKYTHMMHHCRKKKFPEPNRRWAFHARNSLKKWNHKTWKKRKVVNFQIFLHALSQRATYRRRSIEGIIRRQFFSTIISSFFTGLEHWLDSLFPPNSWYIARLRLFWYIEPEFALFNFRRIPRTLSMRSSARFDFSFFLQPQVPLSALFQTFPVLITPQNS